MHPRNWIDIYYLFGSVIVSVCSIFVIYLKDTENILQNILQIIYIISTICLSYVDSLK